MEQGQENFSLILTPRKLMLSFYKMTIRTSRDTDASIGPPRLEHLKREVDGGYRKLIIKRDYNFYLVGLTKTDWQLIRIVGGCFLCQFRETSTETQ